jgi:recombination DNA repair RAD52 pathway protein
MKSNPTEAVTVTPKDDADRMTDDSYLSSRQQEQLLRDLNPVRVKQRQQAGRNLSYLGQEDVRAHLIRMFGFARWSSDVRATQMLFEDQVPATDKKGKPLTDENGVAVMHWQVGWQSMVRLTVCAPDGTVLATYTETAIGGSKQPSRSEAHDMALKTATSDALKRCAINLGDQFGLGLYRKVGRGPMVMATLLDEKPPAELPQPDPEPDPEAQLEHSVGLARDDEAGEYS